MNRLAILGAGSWGTALASVLAPNFASVGLWVRQYKLAVEIAEIRENRTYLSGVKLPENVNPTHDLTQCLEGAEIVLVTIPSAYLRSVLDSAAGLIPENAVIVSATKGLEPRTLFRMSEVVRHATHIRAERVVALSGPSFAQELALYLPTAVVLGGFPEATRTVQLAFARPSFRLYTSHDTVGVELGGALKNVVAIGAGIATGLGLGHNAVAALITRGLAEITRLAVSLGAEPRTLAGLAGLGDLVLTCTGDLSRNRLLGIELSRVSNADSVLKSFPMTAEGVAAAKAAVELGRAQGIELPVAEQMCAVLESGRLPSDAIRRLMIRSLKEE